MSNDTIKFTYRAPYGRGAHKEWELHGFLTEFSKVQAVGCARAEYSAMTPAQRKAQTARLAAWSPRLNSLFAPTVSALAFEGEIVGSLDELKRRASDVGFGPGVAHHTLDGTVRVIIPLFEPAGAENAAAVCKGVASRLGITVSREPYQDQFYFFPASFDGEECGVAWLDGIGALRIIVE